MSWYKCNECGHIFEEGEEHRWSEGRGEFWGMACSEEMSGCPLCDGDYEETVRCELCEGEFLADELCGYCCDECINSYINDIETCFAIGKEATENIELNGLLTSIFSKEEIEEILMNALREEQKKKPVDCSDFIDADRSWFAEMLVEEVNKK